MNCPSFEDLILYSENDPSTVALSTHLASCRQCQSLLADIQMMTQAIHDDTPGETDEALIQDILQRARPKRKARPWLISLLTVAAAAVILALPLANQDESEFLPRGEEQVHPDRWVSIEVFRSKKGNRLEPLRGPLASREALAFSYTRKPDEPYRYLMILGLGAQGQVYWYYPAYTESGSNPCSLPLAEEARDALLPDQIEHNLASGPLRIQAIFSVRPYCVAEVEALVAREQWTSERAPPRLNLPDTAQHALDFTVEADLEIKD